MPHLTYHVTMDVFFYGSITFYGVLSLLVYSKWMSAYTEKQTQRLLRCFAGFHIIMLAAMFITLYLFPDASGHLMYYDRLKGFFKDPNVFASYLLLSFFWFMYDMRWNVIVRVMGMCLVGGAIYFTGSRIALLCMVIPLVLKWREMSRSSQFLTFVLCLGIGSYLWLGTERYTLQVYDLTRFQVQWEALQLAWQHPFGIGAGEAEAALHHSPHQTYVRVLLENGFLGLIGYLIAIGFLFMKLVKTKETLGKVGLAFIVSLIIMNMVIDTLHWRHAWIFIGMAIGRGGRHHSNCFFNHTYATHWRCATSRPSTSRSTGYKRP
ncbi:O-antigen ligase family protein [Chryseomicrobium palamuruense]|uniref:O-antigen ligase family protein n=1 Tax=Chryseomicrobium palamuruense TaxID=682973 RepID=A0ABV8UXF6_9BACL